MAGEARSVFCHLREAAGLKLEEAARRLRVSIVRAGKFESGAAELTVRQIQILEKLILKAEKTKKITKTFKYYDFFAGCGMASVGLGDGWHCVFANDINETKALVYKAYHGDQSFVLKDVKQVKTCELPGAADLAWASFPCQDLSLAGNGLGLKSARSGLFFSFWHLIRSLDKEKRAPRVIVLENVCGLLTANNGQDFVTIASAFSGRGYRFGAVVIDAVRFLPQSRPRVFIIGVHRDVRLEPSLLSNEASPFWHPKALREAYGRLSKAAASKWRWWDLPPPPPRTHDLADIIEGTPTGVKWHTLTETKYLLSLMDAGNRKKLEAAKELNRPRIGAVYKRMRPDGKGGRVQRAEVRFDNIAGCLRTPNGGSSRQTILVVNGQKVRSRLLSPREAARLMGLPDDFPLPVRYNDAYHLAGDGVAPPVVQHLARNLIEPLLAFSSDYQISRSSLRQFKAA